MFQHDNYGLKRLELGDKNIEIKFAIQKRCKDFNNPQVEPGS